MTYTEGIAYLANLGKFGIHLGLERIELLLTALGHPEREIKTIHIAGTNGKGSVTSMVAEIIAAAGLKVGKFTSPHFVRYNERIAINDEPIADEAFATYLTSTKQAVEKAVAAGSEHPTQFEILTAMAFLYFKEQKVDYAVIEVGLGGLYDSTNVITPEVVAITNVAYDHMEVLGSTLEQIALQKAGVIKDKVPVVTAATGEALGPIQAMCFFKAAPLYYYGNAFSGEEVTSSITGQTFRLHSGSYASEYSINLLGEHQIANACVAIVTAKLLSLRDKRITEEALHVGASRTKWPGRLEVIEAKPTVILDGAHNPQGAQALRAALDKYFPREAIHFVFGMMADKAVSEVCATLFRSCDRVYTVRADDGPRAAESEYLATLIHKCHATPYSSLPEAYSAARQQAGASGIVCVCGSLYLIGSFKALAEQGALGR